MRVDWSQVLTNVISAVIIGVVASAIGIIWKGATTVDDTVKAATGSIIDQQERFDAAIQIIQKEMQAGAQRDADIMARLDKLAAPSGSPKEFMSSPPPPLPILEDDFIQQRLPEQRTAPLVLPKGR